MPDDHYIVLAERAKWLVARIEAKRKIKWETKWDEHELAALLWALERLGDER